MSVKNNLVPLSRVVHAAIIDMREDIGKVKQTYTHWAGRGLKLLDRQILKVGGRKSVLLHVNRNTRTASLPPDFEEETFVAVVDTLGNKIALKINNLITDTKNIEEIECADRCPKCNADKTICRDLSVTETASVVVINGVNYEQVITKKLQPNGDFYLETRVPYMDIDTSTVGYKTSKNFVAHIDLKPCGCIEESESNISTIQVVNPEVYCTYYAGCDNSCSTNYGGYKVFPETGLIQFDYNYKFSKVYLEYKGFMPKLNGQYHVPAVAFECLVELIKFMSVKNKRNESRFDAREYERYYINAKKDMDRVLGRTSLSNILNSILTTPKFDIYVEKYIPRSVIFPDTETVVTADTKIICLTDTSTSTTTVVATPAHMYIPYTFGVIVGTPDAPIEGSSTWSPLFLKDAINLAVLFLNDTTLTLAKGDFTFDPTIPLIDISPNQFFNGDVLVGEYFKYI